MARDFLPKVYWLLPLFSALVWLGMLLGLLIHWVAIGKPHYPSMEASQTIAYISDTGAYYLKPLFIAGSAVVVITLDLSLITERWLRHTGRLAPNTSWAQKLMSIIAIIASIAGAAGLILLSCFDTYRHPTLHDHFLILFLAGYVVSAIFMFIEFWLLGAKFKSHPVLRASAFIKLAFIIIEVALAIPFGIFETHGTHSNVAAILEWTIAFIFTFYVFSYIIDLLPAFRHSERMSHPGFTDTLGLEKDINGNLYKPAGPIMDSENFAHQDELTNANGHGRHGHHGHTNGHQTNGYTNGNSNGYTNGNTNGYTNGYTNGTNGNVNGNRATNF